MASGKQQLMRDEALAQWWAHVKSDPRFDLVLVYGRAELAENKSGWEQLQGANAALDMLRTFSDNEESPSLPISSGLIHDFSLPQLPKKKPIPETPKPEKA